MRLKAAKIKMTIGRMVVQAKTRDEHPYVVRHTHFDVRIQKAKKKKDAIVFFRTKFIWMRSF